MPRRPVEGTHSTTCAADDQDVDPNVVPFLPLAIRTALDRFDAARRVVARAIAENDAKPATREAVRVDEHLRTLLDAIDSERDAVLDAWRSAEVSGPVASAIIEDVAAALLDAS